MKNGQSGQWPVRRSHRDDDDRVQTFEEHAAGASEIAAKCGAPIGMDRMAGCAAYVHDIGKCCEAFQNRLFSQGPRVDHSTAGALWLYERHAVEQAFCVAGHHGGLPDVLDFKKRLASNRKLTPDMAAAAEQNNPYLDGLTEHFDKSYGGYASFAIRGLFSCLVEGDWSDSAEFETDISYSDRILHPDPSKIRPMHPDVTQVTGDMCNIRNAILDACVRAGRQNPPGLYSLTVPTGSGKTRSSMAFALEQAAAHGFRRIVYVIPYRSIIDQTAAVFREVFGDDQVMAVHSSVDFDADGDLENNRRNAQRWNAPIVVTTAVTFFETMYAARPSACIRLHSLFRSVVVFDEIQSLPVERIKPCLRAVSALLSVYQCSVLFCTATQPSFGRFLKEQPVEIVQKDYWDVMRRVTYRFLPDVLSQKQLCHMLLEKASTLCVLNTRKQTQTLYFAMKETSPEGLYHLSTLMYPAHREQVEHEITERLRQRQVCRLVSTSVVEAGMDLDFESVFRELFGLVNVVQAAGRCNREGRASGDDSRVTVFCLNDEACRKKYHLPESVICRRMLEQYGTDIDRPDAIRSYFEQLYGLKDGHGSFDKDQTCRTDEGLLFKTTAECFRMIDDASCLVYVLPDISVFYEDRKKADRYAVSIDRRRFTAMCDAGVVRRIDFAEHAGFLCEPSYYGEAGLDLAKIDLDSLTTGRGIISNHMAV